MTLYQPSFLIQLGAVYTYHLPESRKGVPRDWSKVTLENVILKVLATLMVNH